MDSIADPVTGLLLIAHGARDPAWAAPFQDVVRRIHQARPGVRVALSYLELMIPTVEEGAHQLAAAGCTAVHVLPMFLGASGHVRRDIPPLIARLEAHYGARIRWTQHGAIGQAEAVMQAMAHTALAWLDAAAQPRQ
jgi:sirohydrochlorin cobaltochelatase